ncbi:DUF4870 domain-containing protein [Microbacterium sp. SORGH_AS_0888]|uniref:DUF4870 domain-containing protein n=1 Tax=Microbacterium sp. SORGH_AS_0888 TaxID=3041791 RepID=UPI00277EB6E8|nr:DUF4870 domain-containing protein [Microbacterium sp. SORGH_AS_0888]MDQ1128005.1 putative Tic20 family protein [Microbacterium sp. SORGH_AS_0888]
MSDNIPHPEQPPIPPQQPPASPQPPSYQPPAAPQQPGAYPPPGGYQQPGGYPQPGYQQAPYAGGAQPLTADGDRQAAMWAHIGGVVGFLPSLLIWLILKDRGPRVAVEGKEALNWQITWIIAYVALGILSVIVGAIPFLGIIAILFGLLQFALWVVNVIFSIIGGVRVNAGGSYRYPVNFRFIK